ncbi:hypothetical protein [Nocardioides zeae]|uniref:Energy-coupling factor transporter ATP-binding protein EcfA2 n=1 Tax=Nocardioides zeae TaxID=1457234 RepID=A0AAJ1TVR2_9ACTN|nr:hypothetical protein [Nocardioides zeae]MDQ1102869.1 energy-coupling factor transporter ATP-binding protein EcfA2 [Nocardioides zeae]
MSERKQSGVLAEELQVSTHYLRAANVELTADASVKHYLPTARALDVLSRVASTLEGDRGKAWSLTGPYGTGKSSFALFLGALLAPTSTSLREPAFDILRASDPALANRLTRVLANRSELAGGFAAAVVTAEREPISVTLARALTRGAIKYFGSEERLPREIANALRVSTADPRPDTLRTALRHLAAACPVLVLIDEFGKNLEHFTDRPDEGDLFALQALAEEAASGAGTVLFFTLQHLAFDDYARAHGLLERREWAKVQGRFEDVAFSETSDDVARLIAKAIGSESASPKFRKARRAWAEAAMPRLEEIGLGAEFSNGVETLELCYPLHPLAVLALPDLCARFGQHGRTLLSFLAGSEPKSLGEYLLTARWSERDLPTVGLEDVYDFFVASAARQLQASTGASRWQEIDSRICEASALPADQQRILKIVGLLNLVSQGGLLRASAPLVSLALGDGRTTSTGAPAALEDLVGRGVLAYRRFADEFRLWQGSDFDLPAAMQVERDRLKDSSIAHLLSERQGPRHVVAGRHSQEVGMLRYFEVAYVDHLRGLPTEQTAADGWVAYHVGPEGDLPQVRKSLLASTQPVVLLSVPEVDSLCSLVLEAAAVDAVQHWPELDGDWVARREVRERASLLSRQLSEAVPDHFDPRRADVAVVLLRGDRAEPLRTVVAASSSISPILSHVCDLVYPQSPVIKNEMLARRELSSQGARARRELMTAMIEHGSEEKLGLEGYGPERAMYEAFLYETGMHVATPTEAGGWAFQAPKRGNRLRYAYEALQSAMLTSPESPRTAADLMAELRRAPFGVTDGPLPVLLLTALLEHKDDVAIFEDGTYLPDFSADAAERMVKSPARFLIKHFAVSGGRQRVLDALVAELVGNSSVAGLRNQGLMQAVAPLLRTVRRLPDSVRYDATLSPTAIAVRDALLAARDPDQLLFVTLPVACGLEPITTRTSHKDGQLFVERLRDAVGELEGAYATMLGWISQSLSTALNLSPAISELRADLQALGRRLGDKILDPKLQAFVQLASTDGLDDENWLEAMGLALSERPPVSWRTADRERFSSTLLAAASTIGRLEILHFESVVEPMEGFVAQRHTITRADGTEEGMLVVANETAVVSARAEAGRIVDSYLEQGSHELNAFILALWAEVQDRGASGAPATIPRAVNERMEAERKEEHA